MLSKLIKNYKPTKELWNSLEININLIQKCYKNTIEISDINFYHILIFLNIYLINEEKQKLMINIMNYYLNSLKIH